MEEAFLKLLRMKLKLIILLFLGFVGFTGMAQKITPAKWSWTLEPANPKVGQTAEIIFKVKIDKGWYLYSSDFDKELGDTRRESARPTNQRPSPPKKIAIMTDRLLVLLILRLN